MNTQQQKPAVTDCIAKQTSIKARNIMSKKTVGVLILAAIACGISWAQGDSVADKPGNTLASADIPTADLKASAPTSAPAYIIGAQDTLHISVWKESDLSATLPVRSDGMISLPLLNDVQAAGLTPMQLAADLTLKLKRFVAAPRVTVVVTQMNSQRVYVLGEVVHTGPVLLIPGMTVLQALATSGFSQFANTKAIYILRSERGDQQRLPFNYKQVVRGEAMDQNIVLKPGDTIVVP